VILLNNKLDGSEDSFSSLKPIKEWFEFGAYYHLIVFASPLIYMISLNEITNSEIASGFYTTSDLLSVVVFCLLLVLTFLPIFSIMIGKGERHFSTGLNKERKAKLFYTVMMLKFLACSSIFIMVNSKKMQMTSFLAMTIVSLIYLVWAKPLELQIANSIAILNEASIVGLTLYQILLLMVYSIKGSNGLSVGLFTMAVSANLMISFLLSLASQVNTVWNKSKQDRSEELRSERSSKIDTFDTQCSTSKLSL